MSGSVSGLNPDIYKQVGQGVTPLANPLTQYAQTIQTTNGLLGLRAQQAKQAAGQAFQASINPDGTTNQTALLQNLAANPAAAMSAQDSAQAGQTLSTGEYAQHMARLNYGASGAVQLLTAPGGPTLPAVKAYYDQAVQDGHVTPQDEQSVLAGFTADPNQNRQVILQRLQQNVGAQQALTNAVGAPGTMANGQTIQPGMVGGVTGNAPGAFTPAGSATPQLLTPGQLAAPQTIGVTPQGAPVTGTTGQFLEKTGTGQNGQTIPSPLGTGRLPTALMNPNRPGGAPPGAVRAGSPGYAPAQPSPAAQAPAAPSGIVTGLGPAQTTALTQQGGESQKAFQGIADEGVQAQQQNATLGNMLADAKGFASGQTDLNAVKATMQKYAPIVAKQFGVSADSVAANESFDKLANQIATAQGADSDARLSVRQGANPSSHLSPQGVDLILRQLQGNADYKAARAKLASAYPDQADRAGFESKIGSTIDPRAFQFDRMTPDQRITYAKSLSPTDQKKVQAAYVIAGQQGLLSSGWTPNGQ